jgi:hypothetical protein
MAKATHSETITENIWEIGGDLDAYIAGAMTRLSQRAPKLIFVYSVSPRGKVVASGFSGWSRMPVDTPATRGTLLDHGGFFKDGKVVELSAGYQKKLNRANSRTSNRYSSKPETLIKHARD